MRAKFTEAELIQLKRLVAKARGSRELQDFAEISYMEAINLNSKLTDILEGKKVDCANYRIVNETNLLVNGVEVVIPKNFDFEDAELGYRIEERKEIIDNLISWIAEANDRPSDKQIMKDDLEYLMGLEDDYVFSSYTTNEYIACSDNKERFIQIAEEFRVAIDELEVA
jgi:hypothetical protein